MGNRRTGGYLALTRDGNVYIGISGHLDRRQKEHKRKGKHVVESYEDIGSVESDWERQAIQFYESQEDDGEAFHVLNQRKSKRWKKRRG